MSSPLFLMTATFRLNGSHYATLEGMRAIAVTLCSLQGDNPSPVMLVVNANQDTNASSGNHAHTKHYVSVEKPIATPDQVPLSHVNGTQFYPPGVLFLEIRFILKLCQTNMNINTALPRHAGALSARRLVKPVHTDYSLCNRCAAA